MTAGDGLKRIATTMNMNEILEGWCKEFPIRRLALWEFCDWDKTPWAARVKVSHKALFNQRFGPIDAAKTKLLAELDKLVRSSCAGRGLLVHCLPEVIATNEHDHILFVAHMTGWVTDRKTALQAGMSINKEVGYGHVAWRYDVTDATCLVGKPPRPRAAARSVTWHHGRP
jgi:hypothetical protein